MLSETLSYDVPATSSPARILVASLIGTTIEFFDFYIYATAAVLVFPKLFFSAADPASATLQSLATFALAFFARPLGSAVFGHFGDRIGRKSTLVAALLTMGLSTVGIGVLPTYQAIGLWAPALLALCRFGQGFGLGGEWGGAVLLATENAPAGRAAWYGMFPQLGAPIGFIISASSFLLLGKLFTEQDFLQWAWRIPFLCSSLLVLLGLYVRLTLSETAAFRRAIDNDERVPVPILHVLREHSLQLLLGTLATVVTFLVFYIMTVFALGWGVGVLHYPRQEFLILQLIGVCFFALTIPLSAVLADRFSSRSVLVVIAAAIALFGLALAPLFGSGSTMGLLAFLILGFALTGLTYGPLGVALAQLFPTALRYTGASLTFNLAGILGASLAPYLATALAARFGLAAVGWYMSASAVVSLLALIAIRPHRDSTS
jgi:metabolite-proton symporter